MLVSRMNWNSNKIYSVLKWESNTYPIVRCPLAVQNPNKVSLSMLVSRMIWNSNIIYSVLKWESKKYPIVRCPLAVPNTNKVSLSMFFPEWFEIVTTFSQFWNENQKQRKSNWLRASQTLRAARPTCSEGALARLMARRRVIERLPACLPAFLLFCLCLPAWLPVFCPACMRVSQSACKHV